MPHYFNDNAATLRIMTLEISDLGSWPKDAVNGCALVVPVLPNAWALRFAMESAMRLKDEGLHVSYLDPNDWTSPLLEVNEHDYWQRWRFRDPRPLLRDVLEGHGIKVEAPVCNSTGLAGIPKFSSRDSLERWTVHGLPSGKVVSSVVSGTRKNPEFDVSENSKYVRLLQIEHVRVLDMLLNCIKETCPNYIVTSNDRTLVGGTVTALAAQLGIPCVVGYWGSSPDKFACWHSSLYSSQAVRDQMSWWYRRWQTSESVQQTVRAEFHQAKRQLMGADRFGQSLDHTRTEKSGTKKLAVFFPTSTYEFSAMATAESSGYSQHLFACQIAECLDRDEWDFVIRHHPIAIDDPFVPDWEPWDLSADHGWPTQVPPSSDVSSYQLLDQAHLVFVWASTIGVEAAARGKGLIIGGFPTWLSMDRLIAHQSQELSTRILDGGLRLTEGDVAAHLARARLLGEDFRYVSGNSPFDLKVGTLRIFQATIIGSIAFLLKLHRAKSALRSLNGNRRTLIRKIFQR